MPISKDKKAMYNKTYYDKHKQKFKDKYQANKQNIKAKYIPKEPKYKWAITINDTIYEYPSKKDIINKIKRVKIHNT